METLSSGYFGAEVDVEAYPEDRVIISPELFSAIRNRTSKSSSPMTLKLDKTYFPAYVESTLPSGMLVIPRRAIGNLDIAPPCTSYIWIPKNQKRAERILWQ